jgi:hypothetical protein
MRTTKELRDKIEEAASTSGRSLVQEVEFRLERSFRQQEIESEINNALYAWAHSYRDELIGEMQKMIEKFQRARGLTDKEIAADAQRPKLSDLGEWPRKEVREMSDDELAKRIAEAEAAEQRAADKREDSQ